MTSNGKYVKTGGDQKFEIIEARKKDPNNDLPKIHCKGSEKSHHELDVLKTKERWDVASAKPTDVEADEWSPVRNKRKKRTPEASDNDKQY